MQPKLSILMPTRNEDPLVVAATIHGAIATTYGHSCEIIVIDDGSDEPFEFQHPLVKVVRNPTPIGEAGARALGCTLATGDILAMIDAHMSFAPGWFEAFLPHVASRALLCSPWYDYRHTKVYCWGCDFTWNPVAVREAVGFGYRGRIDRPDGEAPEIPMVIGACYVILREEFERIGGYTPVFSGYGCTEQELSARAWLMGYGVRCITGAQVGHLDRELDVRDGRLGSVPYQIRSTHFLHNQYAMLQSLFEEETVALLSQYYEPLNDETAHSLDGLDIGSWRQQVQAERRQTDAAYFRRFVPDVPLTFGRRGTRLRRGERPIKAAVAAAAKEEDRLWSQVAKRTTAAPRVSEPPATIRAEGRSRIVCFSCLGVRIKIRMTNAGWLEPVLDSLPPHCEPHEGDHVEVSYTLRGTNPRIEVDGRLLDSSRPVSDIFEHLQASIADEVVAHATDYVFVDAGVVSDRDGAIVLLGDRHSGRFALQAELLRQGATYYSDAYAIFDSQGRVYPWARQPCTSTSPGLPGRTWPLSALAPCIGTHAVPLSQVVMSHVFPRGRWNPQCRSPGEGLAALLKAVVSRGPPGPEAFIALHAACQRLMVWEGERSSASRTANFLLSRTVNP